MKIICKSNAKAGSLKTFKNEISLSFDISSYIEVENQKIIKHENLSSVPCITEETMHKDELILRYFLE